MRTRLKFALGAFLAGCAFGAVTGQADVAAAPGAPARQSRPTWIEAIYLPGAKSARAVPGAGADAMAARLSELPGVVSAEPVFGSSERAYLGKGREAILAGAVRVRVASRKSFESLKRGEGLPAALRGGRFEVNPAVKLFSLPREPHPEQWGLRNAGVPQEVVITDILSRFNQSVAGEDAGVLNAPAEPKDRKALVAVIDTGVELTHPALSSVIHRSESECKAAEEYRVCMNTQVDKNACHDRYASLDTDGNGYPLDCAGWDVTATPGSKDERTGIAGSNDVKDRIGHGTHIAGIIAARGAGASAISGIASQVEILPVKVLRSPAEGADAGAPGVELPDPRSPEFTQETGIADLVARGVLYAIRSKAQVLNLSLGYSINEDSELVRRMIGLAQSQGILVVAAAGNESSRTPVFPCRYPGVVCVASFSADGSISHFSNYGDSTDIAAPGYSILSAWPMLSYPSFHTERKGYDFKSGTSMAAPFVAGALARLVNHGFSPAEAYARLVLGARPTRPPTAMAELTRKFTLSGNLDLARAFAVEPQPLILPEFKESVFARLDRQSGGASLTSAPFKLSLKNYWRPARLVQVRVAISADSPLARSRVRLEGARPDGGLLTVVDGWKTDETREIAARLVWDAPLEEIPGELYLDVTVTVPGMGERTVKKDLEVVVPVRPQASGAAPADPRIRRVETDLRGDSLKHNYSIKPVTCLPSAEAASGEGLAQDLLLIQSPGNSTVLQLLKSDAAAPSGEGTRYLKTGGYVIENAKSQLYAFSCLDQDGDGKREYVVAEAVGRDKEEKKLVFTFLDPLFRHPRGGLKLEIDTETVVPPDEFRWLRGPKNSKSTGSDTRLWPAFVARGRKPKAEVPPRSPWETRPAELLNPPDTRLYYVDPDGLHTLAPPQGYRIASLVKPTEAELRDGEASVLLFKGTEYVLDFYVAKLARGVFGAPQKLDFSIYHRLAGLKSLASLSVAQLATGVTAYFEEGTAGRLRVSVQPPRAQGSTLLPWVLEPVKSGDLLSQVVAVFGDSAGSAQAFSRSRYQLYFHDRKSGLTLGTDLKQHESSTRHLPAWVQGRPAMFLAEGQGNSITTEFIVPVALDGVSELIRPAGLKTIGVDGCGLIQMRPTGALGSGGAPADATRALIYFCGDHFVEITL